MMVHKLIVLALRVHYKNFKRHNLISSTLYKFMLKSYIMPLFMGVIRTINSRKMFIEDIFVIFYFNVDL